MFATVEVEGKLAAFLPPGKGLKAVKGRQAIGEMAMRSVATPLDGKGNGTLITPGLVFGGCRVGVELLVVLLPSPS